MENKSFVLMLPAKRSNFEEMDKKDGAALDYWRLSFILRKDR